MSMMPVTPGFTSKAQWPVFSDLPNAGLAHWIWLPDQDGADEGLRPDLQVATGDPAVPPGPRERVNLTACFSRDFTWAAPAADDSKRVWLHVAADSNYAAWLNGQLIDCGQFGNFPTDKTYDSLDITDKIQPGVNKLRFLVHYQGETNFSYLRGEPGLLFLVQSDSQPTQPIAASDSQPTQPVAASNSQPTQPVAVSDSQPTQPVAVSDSQTVGRLSPAYHQGPIYWTTGQLGFSFAYNALAEDDWLNQPANGGWSQAVMPNPQHEHYRLDIRPRPLPKLMLEPPAPAKLIAQGTLMRSLPDGWQQRLTEPTPAQAMQSDYLSASTRLDFLAPGAWSQPGCDTDLPPDPAAWPEGLSVRPEIVARNQGLYLIFDLGREEVGFLDLDIEAGPGTIIDLAHGEHLADQRVRATVGGRHFANRIVCRDGRTQLTHVLRRLGGRYLELHIFPTDTRLAVYRVTLRPSPYPLQNRGTFICSDSLHNRIHEVSRRTLHLCMHEHYEDCPWREQALYAMDSRNQALCGYYCFGEYDFPGVSFALLGNSLQPDGFLELIAPSTFSRTIPSFSMAWIVEVWEHFLYSGRSDDLRRQFMAVRQILEKRLTTMIDGLLPTPTASHCWNFYEWADGLSGDDDPWLYAHADVVRYDAPLNLFFLLALRAAARMAVHLDEPDLAAAWSTTAEHLAGQIHIRFWHDGLGCYQTYLWPDDHDLPNAARPPEVNSASPPSPHTAELTQALALFAGVCPANQAGVLRRLLADGRPGLVEVTLSHSIYKFEALLAEPKIYAALVFDRIARDWGTMLMQGATSFWETIKGSCDFNQAGSLCHGWSAIPVYLYQAYVLGVKPLEPGFSQSQIQPLTAVFPRFSGSVPTPQGPIEVCWDAADAVSPLQINAPPDLKLEVSVTDSRLTPIIGKRK